MAKPRELTDVEKFYIENNLQKSDNEIASKMPGIGAKTVSKYRESVPETKDSVDTDHVEETQKERIDRLGNGPAAGDFFSRRDGVSIMTEQVSEITDARKVVKGNQMSKEEFERTNRDKIHRPHG